MKYCKNCIHKWAYICSEPMGCTKNASSDDYLIPGKDPEANFNKDNDCKHYKRIWWKIFY